MKIDIKDIKIGFSELTGEVYAGKLSKDGTKWIEKVNVTSQYLFVVKNRKPENQQTPESKTTPDGYVVNGSDFYPANSTSLSRREKSEGVPVYFESAISHHQEANEINVCFSKPYQNLQRELFEKKKEIESFKEANAKLVEALRDAQVLLSELVDKNNPKLKFGLKHFSKLLQTYETK